MHRKIPASAMSLLRLIDMKWARASAIMVWNFQGWFLIIMATWEVFCVNLKISCCWSLWNNTVTLKTKGAIWPSLNPCTVINPILLTYLLLKPEPFKYQSKASGLSSILGCHPRKINAIPAQYYYIISLCRQGPDLSDFNGFAEVYIMNLIK